MTICALVGATDFNAADFQAAYEEGLFDCVIAVDGGFAHLEAIGVKPDMAVGDFDSLGYVPNARRVAKYPAEKDASDMELAMQKAVNFRHDELVIYGGIGGRLDHTIANMQLFARFSEAGQAVTAVADSFAIRFLAGPDVFELPEGVSGGTVSVFSLSDCAQGVIETGLKYSFNDEPLTNRTTRGLSNELTGRRATVAVESGTLCVFYPLQ